MDFSKKHTVFDSPTPMDSSLPETIDGGAASSFTSDPTLDHRTIVQHHQINSSSSLTQWLLNLQAATAASPPDSPNTYDGLPHSSTAVATPPPLTSTPQLPISNPNLRATTSSTDPLGLFVKQPIRGLSLQAPTSRSNVPTRTPSLSSSCYSGSEAYTTVTTNATSEHASDLGSLPCSNTTSSTQQQPVSLLSQMLLVSNSISSSSISNSKPPSIAAPSVTSSPHLGGSGIMLKEGPAVAGHHSTINPHDGWPAATMLSGIASVPDPAQADVKVIQTERKGSLMFMEPKEIVEKSKTMELQQPLPEKPQTTDVVEPTASATDSHLGITVARPTEPAVIRKGCLTFAVVPSGTSTAPRAAPFIEKKPSKMKIGSPFAKERQSMADDEDDDADEIDDEEDEEDEEDENEEDEDEAEVSAEEDGVSAGSEGYEEDLEDGSSSEEDGSIFGEGSLSSSSSVSLSINQSKLNAALSANLRRHGNNDSITSNISLEPTTINHTTPSGAELSTAILSATSYSKLPGSHCRFPTSLIFPDRHSNLPRTPNPSPTRQPRIRRSGRNRSKKSRKDPVCRDDFLPDYLKSDEGRRKVDEKEKARESSRGRSRDGNRSTAWSSDVGGATSGGGRCTRHRSPPPPKSRRGSSRVSQRPLPPSAASVATIKPLKTPPLPSILLPSSSVGVLPSSPNPRSSTHGWKSDEPSRSSVLQARSTSITDQLPSVFDLEEDEEKPLTPPTQVLLPQSDLPVPARRSSVSTALSYFKRGLVSYDYNQSATTAPAVVLDSTNAVASSSFKSLHAPTTGDFGNAQDRLSRTFQKSSSSSFAIPQQPSPSPSRSLHCTGGRPRSFTTSDAAVRSGPIPCPKPAMRMNNLDWGDR